MRILVTGATGFIGRHLCKRLVEQNHQVLALVRTPSKASVLPKRNITLLEGDLSLFKDPRLVLPECDYVIHLAGVVAARSDAEYRAINYTAVVDLVECLGRQSWRPKRMLFASSLAATGPSKGPLKRESDRDAPIEPYGAAKEEAERYLKKHAPFPTTSFRPAVVFGGDDPAALTLFKLARKGVGFRPSGPLQVISFVYIDDLVAAIELMITDERTDHQVYFVSYPKPTDVGTLWSALSDATSRNVRVIKIPRPMLYSAALLMTGLSRVFRFTNQLDIKQYRQMTAPAFVCTSEALMKDRGWAPKHDLQEAVSLTARAYFQAGLLN